MATKTTAKPKLPDNGGNDKRYNPRAVATENKAGGSVEMPGADYGVRSAYGKGSGLRRKGAMLTADDDMDHLQGKFAKKGAGH